MNTINIIDNFDQQILMENIIISNQKNLLDMIIDIFEFGYLSDKVLDKKIVSEYLNEQKFINWKLFINLINLDSTFNSKKGIQKSIYYLIESKSYKLLEFLLDLSLESENEIIVWDNKLNNKNLFYIILRKFYMCSNIINKIINLISTDDKYKLLFKEKNNVNKSAEFFAIRNCSESVILKLLNLNLISMDWTDNYANTLVHLSCKKNYVELFNWLVEKNVDLYKKNKGNRIPLHLACIKNNFEIAHKLILDEKFDQTIHIDIDLNEPIDYAIKYSDSLLVKLILEKSTNITNKKKIFYNLIKYQSEDMIEYYINNKFVYIDQTNIFWTVLLYYQKSLYKQIYLYLIKKMNLFATNCIVDFNDCYNKYFDFDVDFNVDFDVDFDKTN